MNKVLFIVPPTIEYEDFVHPPAGVRVVRKEDGVYGNVLTDMPLGALALSAYLKKYAGVETKLIDFNVVLNKLKKFEHASFDDFFRAALLDLKPSGFEPAIIGISALFMSVFETAVSIARCSRKIFPDALIVAGGGVPTNLYKEIFENSTSFDALCYGEGERPLLRLVQAEDKIEQLESDPSWITPAKIGRGETFKHDMIEDLDEIPMYDYAICSPEDYRLNSTISSYPGSGGKKRYITTMSSRGCVHRCCFCSAHSVHGRQMRYYSLDRIRQDFRFVKEKYGIETIIFQDDHFMAKTERALEIIGILKELGLTAFFQNALALYKLDRKMLEALKSIGINDLVMAIESGSARVLKDIMHKPLNLKIVRRVAADCRELGIYTDANLILGLPGETKQDIEDARAFLKTVGANWFRIFTASPGAGSEMFEICRKKGYIKGSYTNTNYKRAVIETEDFTAEYIQEKAYLMNLELNFVENSDIRAGDYKTALIGLENAIKAKSDHAFAYYYAGICYEKLGDTVKGTEYLIRAREITAGSDYWRKFAEMFEIPI